MRRTRLFCMIGVSVWLAVADRQPGAPPMALSGALRAHLKDAPFGIVTSIRGLPLGVRDGLQTLFGTQTLALAEPKAKFQATDVMVESEPADSSAGRGGVLNRLLPRLLRARRHRPHVARRAVSLDACRDPIRVGGNAPGGLATIEDVRNAILSGAIKGSTRSGSTRWIDAVGRSRSVAFGLQPAHGYCL